MKKIFKYFFPPTVLYISIAFVYMEINSRFWNQDERNLIVCGTLCVWIVMIAYDCFGDYMKDIFK